MRKLDWAIVIVVLVAIGWGAYTVYDLLNPTPQYHRPVQHNAVEECERKVIVEAMFPVARLEDDGTLAGRVIEIVQTQKVFLRSRVVTLGDGSELDLTVWTIEDLRGVIKRMEMDVIIDGGDKMPAGYIALVRELYMRTGGKAPGEKQAVAAYGDSKKPKSTWRKL